MGYEGGRLAPWFDTKPIDEALDLMAKVVSGELLTLTVMFTPVDTGRLKSSWREKPIIHLVNERGDRMRVGGVETNVDYAPYVEWDTRPHIIRPKNPDGWLSWVQPGGGRVFAKVVHHPGTKGAHMVAKAVAEVEATFGTLVAPIVYETMRRIEKQNRTGMGVGRERTRA